MKFSESWLREWVNPNIETDVLVEQLTMAGLEVDATEAVAGVFSNVVVGELLSVEPHPDADKLRVCQVSAGDETFQVVCGAPNARQGLKAPFAKVGAKLPGDFKIKKAKLRGVESFGMLCAQTELQAGEDDSGLWELPAEAPVGSCLREYLQLEDTIIEVDLTPNRGDCLSLKGIAREVGVLNREAVKEPVIEAVAAVHNDVFPVNIGASQQCPRYTGRIIRNVDVSKPTPVWMQEKLRRSGVRSIDAVVDVTNYVLLELGQPMHAFDLEKLNGGIHVRLAEQDESLTLLNGQEIKLTKDTLVIADQQSAIAMAGIMGGESSAVSQTTKHIFLESAFFNPRAIAGKARSYGLHTDSSHRFERGVDFKLQEAAIERATQLLLDITGGEPGPLVQAEVASEIPSTARISLRADHAAKGLGIDIPDQEIEDIIQGLGLTLMSREAGSWSFEVPSYRFDLAIEADLLEELARVYGYNRLPTSELNSRLSPPVNTENLVGLPALRHQLVARGFNEAITYSFVAPDMQKLFDPDKASVELQNPISAEMSVMRTSLWPGLVEVLRHNLNRQQERVRLFETGLRFIPGENGVVQEPVLAGLIYGTKSPESWSASGEKVDFYDLKGDLESLFELTGQGEGFEFSADKHPALHPGQCALIRKNGEVVGYLGTMHPQIQQQLGLQQPAILFEVCQSAIRDARLPVFAELSKFPEVRRDIALIVDKVLPVDNVLAVVRQQAGDYLRELKVFDLYMGKGIDPHRKSVALGLTFQHPSRTLNEDEINASVDAVIKQLEVDFNATLR